jgi:hypothetical protein
VLLYSLDAEEEELDDEEEEAAAPDFAGLPQHFLYFAPLLHGQGSFGFATFFVSSLRLMVLIPNFFKSSSFETF